MNLDEYRLEIEKIDEEIIKLLQERFNIAQKIGEIKKKEGLPIENKNREEYLINKNLSKLSKKKYQDAYLEILKTIICESKKLQEKKEI